MNWLAHTLLSKPNVEFILGNLLADVIKFPANHALPRQMLAGIKWHHQIDRFTDTHSRVHLCKQRLDQQYRRYSGILVDVFFDHLLAKHWHRYCESPLPVFTANVYAEIADYRGPLPGRLPQLLARLSAEDWLGSIVEREDIANVLRRIERRMRRPFPLAEGASQLTRHFSAIEADFLAFFPELCDRFPPHGYSLLE